MGGKVGPILEVKAEFSFLLLRMFPTLNLMSACHIYFLCCSLQSGYVEKDAQDPAAGKEGWIHIT